MKERLRGEVKALVGKGYRDAVKKWAGSLGVKCELLRMALVWGGVGRVGRYGREGDERRVEFG